MGCERVREAGNLGFGGVRASMERRWLINAKTTVMRQRKWQEVQFQKEVDEQRKKTEILERRKQERARLSAYIHSAVQTPVKCASRGAINGKHQRYDNKRLNWKTCLLRDQELILKLRENAKIVAHNQPSKRHSSNSDPVVQGHYTGRMAHCCDSSLPKQGFGTPRRSGAPNLCMSRNLGDSTQLLEVPTMCGEAIAQTPLLEKDTRGEYQMLQLPKRPALTSEIAVNTSATWLPNTIPSKANFVEDHQSPSMFEISKWRSFTSNTAFDKHNGSMSGSQSARSVLPCSADVGAQVATKVAGCCVESADANPQFASLEIALSGTRESVVRRSNPDLNEEILKSRRVNEAATTRLIAQVTAIESRLDDCNMNWKSLCLQDEQIKASPTIGPMQILCADVYPDNLNLVTDANHPFSLERKIEQENSNRVSGIGIKAGKQDFPNLEGQQPAQHLCKTRSSLSPPDAEVSNDISCEATIFGSFLLNGQTKITHKVQENFEREGLQPFQESQRNSGGFAFHQESLGDWGTTSSQAGSQAQKTSNIRLAEQMKYHPECSSICHESKGEPKASVISSLLPFDKHNNNSREYFYHHGDVKLEKESLPCPLKISGNVCDITTMKESCADSMKESHAAWKIDWNAANDISPKMNLEDLQGMQSNYYSCMPNLANINMGDEHLGSCRSQQPHLMYEPRQQVHTNSLQTQGGEDHPPRKLEGGTCPPHFHTCETTGLVQISSDLESVQCFQHQHTCEDTNWAQSPRFGAQLLLGNNMNCKNVDRYVEYSFGDKENHLESQRQSLIEEEEKIFASLERLDWKLAAINLRSMNVGRDSAVSQGQYSTKSAPAIMGPPPCTIMEKISMSAKKVVPYSAIPPRPLTSQGAPMLRIPNGRQRRLVGLTNKAGRMHNLNNKK